MEKLGQLHQEVRANGGDAAAWDLIVVDTPPSRSALDFLDAPKRLGSFLDGRIIRLLVGARQGRRPGRVCAWSTSASALVTGALTKILGGAAAHATSRPSSPRSTPCSAASGSARSRRTRCCQAPGTAFLVVAAPEPDALREASYFVERLAAERMPLAGLVLNRVTAGAAPRTRCGAAPSRRRGSHRRRRPSRRRPAAAARRARAAPPTGSASWPRRFSAATPAPRSSRYRPSADGRARPRRPAAGRRSARRRIAGRYRTARTRWRPGPGRCGRLEQAPPRVHIRVAAQQGAPLALGHAAPDAELGPVVEGVGQALGEDRALLQTILAVLLRGPLHEQGVRVVAHATSLARPVRLQPPAVRVLALPVSPVGLLSMMVTVFPLPLTPCIDPGHESEAGDTRPKVPKPTLGTAALCNHRPRGWFVGADWTSPDGLDMAHWGERAAANRLRRATRDAQTPHTRRSGRSLGCLSSPTMPVPDPWSG